MSLRTEPSPALRRTRAAVRHRVRRLSRLLVMLLSSLFASLAAAQILPPAPNALPSGAQVMVGSGRVSQSGALMIVNQSTARLGIDWQSFDIGSAASVQFVQPGAGSVALNRVVGNDGSAIYGRLSANGQVFLTNPNGVLFAPGAKVDVGGLVASTLDLSQQDFAAGRNTFRDAGGSGSVLNQGRLRAGSGGYLALFGNRVANDGEMTVSAGSVVLATGRAATVSISGSGLLSAVVTPGAQGSVDNRGSISADGGRVTLTARSAENIASSLVNNSGLIRANSLVERNGEVWITGDNVATSGTVSADGSSGLSGGRILVQGDMAHGSVAVGGTLSARSDGGGQGGAIETSAAKVVVADHTRVDTSAPGGRTGSWLIDPTDFTVYAGSGAQNTSGMGANTLSSNLQTASVTLQTANSGSDPGDITVAAAVGWSANTTLTLSAARNINLNANISATGNSAGLVLTPGSSGGYTLGNAAQVTLSGSSPTLTIAGTNFTVVNSLAALQAIGTNSTTLAASYALGSDIDASASGSMNSGAGFMPIGSSTSPTSVYYGSAFSGHFDGFNHSITALQINRPSTAGVGLFANTYNADIRNLTLAGGAVSGNQYAGALIGYAYSTTVSNVNSSAPVTAISNSGATVFVGGLIGEQDHYVSAPGITGSSSSGAVYGEGGSAYAGGLDGYFYSYINSAGGITASNSSAPVTMRQSSYGGGAVGGLVGYFVGYGGISGSSASGAVSTSAPPGSNTYYGGTTGGLVGNFGGYGSITNSHASGAVNNAANSGSYYYYYSGTGGLVGQFSGASISDAQATGVVNGGYYSGGLVGQYGGSSPLSNVSATGNVTGNTYVGGLVGYLSSSGITNGFASGNVSSPTSGGYAGGLVGYALYSASSGIGDSSATGSVTGYYAGGLVGVFYNNSSASASGINNSHASGAVNGSYYAGGLVGYFYDGAGNGAAGSAIGNISYATGNVTGTYYVGGLVGEFIGYRPISDSYATGSVSSTNSASSNISVGGLVGYFYNYASSGGGVARSFASGAVTLAHASGYYYGTDDAGGLVGTLYGGSSITDSYASGSVSATLGSNGLYAGGLVGYLQSAAVNTSYSSGAVSYSASGTGGARQLGGLVGLASSSSTVTNSYWNTTTSGLSSSAGGSGLTSAQMMQAASFGNWNIANTANAGTTWRVYEGHTSPLLSGFLTPVTISLADASRVYDGTTSFNGVSLSSPGGVVAHPETIFAAISASDVGSYSVGATQVYSSQLGYDVTASGSATLTVTPRPLTLAGVVADKVYDSTTSATLIGTAQPSGLVAGQDLTVNAANVSALFSDKNVGSNKTVTLSGYALADGSNGKASNYSLANSTSTTASITAAPLTVGGFSATNRAYDGTAVVAVTATPAGSLGGVFGGDQVSVDLSAVSTGTMADKNVGTAKPVTVNGVSLTGADAGNYYVAGLGQTTVNITPLTLTANGLAATNRNYNASTGVSVSGSSATLTGTLAGDVVDFTRNTLSGNTADANAQNGKAVTVSGLTLLGRDAGNYTLQAGALLVNITPLPITANAYANSTTNKIYDGTTAASVSLSYSNYDGSNLVVLNTGTNYSDKNAGTNKTITVSGMSLSGSAAHNYSLSNTTSTTTGTISPKPLQVTGVLATNRTYDGTTAVSVNVSGANIDTSGVISGDNVAAVIPGGGTVTGSMANKNVGTAKPVTVPGLGLTGSDAANYTLGGSNGVTVNIAVKPLTASYVGVDKVYDGTVYVQTTASSADIVAGDSVQFISNYYYYYYGYASFTGTGAKNVGSNKPISIGYDYLYGTDAANYSFVNAGLGTATASITAKPITAVFSGVNKSYDGTAAATVALNTNSSGVVYGDVVTASDSAVFTGSGAKNVGTGKAISVSGISLSGTDASNYTLSSSSATTSANITPLGVTISGITATNRTYDGTVNVALTAGTVTSSGFIAGDNVSVSLPGAGISTGTMADKNVGSGKPVAVTGLGLVGSDASNYSILGSSTTVDISNKGLTVSYTGVDRVYNGGSGATVIGSSADVVGGDAVGFTQTSVFAGTGAKNVGNNKAVNVSNIALSGTDAGNYSLFNSTATTSASITPKPVTVGYIGVNRVYDGTADTSATVVGSSAQLIAGDVVSIGQSAAFAGDGSAGTGKTVNVSNIALSGSDATNYSLTATSATTTASITPKPIGITGITATNRVYDGTNVVAVNVAGATVDNSAIVSGDSVSVQLPQSGITTGQTTDRNVGTGKPVTVTGLSITGSSAANYMLVGATGLGVNITPLTIGAGFSAADKVYDGTVTALVSASSSDFLQIDAGTVGISATGAFSGEGAKNVGIGKTVAVSNAFLTGASRGNYLLGSTAGTTSASITPLSITPTYLGGSKVYDGSTDAAVTSNTAGIIAGDQVSFAQTAVFGGNGAKNVGSGKPIAISGIAISGGDSGNYSLLATTASASGNITPKPLTVQGLTGITAADRVYDGTTTVAVTVSANGNITPTSSDIVAGDVVMIEVPPAGQTTGNMADKNVGSAKPVVVTGLSLSGTDAANYAIVGANGVSVSITPKPLTAVYAGVNKVYDGTTAASVTGSSTDIVAGDSLAVGGSGVFTGSGAKNVGTGKAITLTTVGMSGSDAGNYALVNSSGSTTADITPRPITASYSGGTKVYDGTVSAPVTSNSGGLIAGDDVSFGQTAVFTGSGAKDAGSGKAVQVSGITLSGNDAGNYMLSNGTATTTASITPRPITIDGLTGITAADRVYDGTVTVAVTVSGSGQPTPHPGDIISGDNVTVNVPGLGQTSGTMADKNVGSGKPVVVTGLTLSGSDAGDYSIAGADGVTVTIAPKPLTAVYAGVNKVYDGTAAASVSGSSGDILGGDVLAIAGSGVFTGSGAKNVGGAKAIAVSGGGLSGSDAGNYSLLNPTGSAIADITPLAVSVGYVGGSRVYDGTVSAPVSVASGSFIAGDSVSVSQTAVFTGSGAKNAGSAKAVQVSGITLSGSDATNYTLLNAGAATTASVTPKPITVDGISGVQAIDRVYDGTTSVAVVVASGGGTVTPSSNDIIAGDSVVIGGQINGQTTGTMANKNVGSAKAVAVTGLTLSGDDAANYSIGAIAGVTVNITPLALAVTGLVPINRTYDGTTLVAINSSAGSLGGAIAGDDVQVAASGVGGSMSNKNAGQNKAVQVTGVALSGADAGNYSVSTGDLRVNIAQRPLNVLATGIDKVYDGSTVAQVGFSDNRLSGDLLTVADSAASFADKNAGSGKTVTVAALSLSGADAGNYQLSSGSTSTSANILPAPLSLTASNQNKIYGNSLGFDGTEFGRTGLVAGETVGQVSLASAGTTTTAGVAAYPIGISGASGGTFDPANYSISYVPGQLQVTPRALSIAADSVSRYADEPNPTSFGFSTSVGGLVNGDHVASASIAVPPLSADAAGGSIFTLTPTGTVFDSGSAANYQIGYQSGLLIVLPKPPRIGDVSSSGTPADGNVQFVVEVDAAQLQQAITELNTSAAVVAQPGGARSAAVRRTLPLPLADAGPAAAVDTADDGTRVTLPALLRTPLISIDPKMRRLISGTE